MPPRAARDFFLILVMISSYILYALSPVRYASLDDEMRSYVNFAAVKLGWEVEHWASHVTNTKSFALQNFYDNGSTKFFIVLFDREFMSRQPKGIKQAIAGHEVGHALEPCEAARYMQGYLPAENCADVVASVIFGAEKMIKALEALKLETSDEYLDIRIGRLIEQFPKARERSLTADSR